MFFINMVLAGFVAMLIDGIIPDNSIKSFVLGMSGFAAFPILKILESLIPEIIKNAITSISNKK